MKKYIVTLNEEAQEEIFVFPTHINHDDFYNMVNGMKHTTDVEKWEYTFREIVSAGFVDEHLLTCYGRSESLGIDSRPQEDTALLKGVSL